MLVASLYFFCFGKRRMTTAAASLLLTGSFLLTYVSVFLLPVLVGFDVIVRRSVRRSATVLGVIVAAHVGLYLVTGYDAWHAFREASHFENPNGFMAMVDPVNYLFTRLEDVSEILLFLGPFLAIVCYRGLRRSEVTPLVTLTYLAILTLGGMYLAGAWRTGETAQIGRAHV